MGTFISLGDAVFALTGKKGFKVDADGTVEYIKITHSKVDGSPIIHPDVVPPTKEEVLAKYEEMIAANQYKVDREKSYPSLEEQADMQFWDQVNSTTTWKDAIAKIKSDNPKE